MKKALSLLIALLMLFGSFGGVFATGEAPVTREQPAAEEPAAERFAAEEPAAEPAAEPSAEQATVTLPEEASGEPAEEPAEIPEEPVEGPGIPDEEPEKPVDPAQLKATYSGQCGDSLYWQLDTATGVLRIYGTGTMYDYDSSNNTAPWRQYTSYTTSVVIEEGVTGLGSYSFYNCAYVTTVSLPDSLQTIGSWAFCYTYRLKAFEVSENNLYFANRYSWDGSLFNKSETTLLYYTAGSHDDTYTVNFENIGNGAFSGARYLDKVIIQDGLQTIGQSAFIASGISFVEIHGTVQSIGAGAFRSCSNLRSLVFLDEKPASVSSSAFTDCPEDLYVYCTGLNAYVWALEDDAEWTYASGKTLPVAVSPVTAYFPTGLIRADAVEEDYTTMSEQYLIELRRANPNDPTDTTHNLAVNYNVSTGDYYDANNEWGYTSQAVMNGGSIVGVNGTNATDLDYCKWRFEKVTGYNRYTIYTDQSYNYKLNQNCCPTAVDSAAIWYYGANDLYNYQNSEKHHAVPTGGSYMASMLDVIYTESGWYSTHLYRAMSFPYNQGYSGKCGDNLYWQVSLNTGILRIFGTGAMYNYNTSDNYAPWYQYADEIYYIEIEEGATSIGSAAFFNLYRAVNVSIPASVTSVNSLAFQLSDRIESYTVAADSQYFCDVDGILFNKSMTRLYNYPPYKPDVDYTVPDGVTMIEAGAFIWSHYLDTVIIPESVTTLGVAVFFYAQKLSTVVVRGNITRLNAQEFYSAKNLHSVIFLGEIPGAVASNAFYNNPSDLCVYYTEPYAYSWAPNGETEWSYEGANTLPLAVFGGEAWVPTETVIANDYNTWRAGNGTPQLVGIKKDGVTQIMVAYNEYASGEWPENNRYYDVGVADAEQLRAYASPAVKNGNHVVGVNGTSATDLAYCEWFFEGEQNAAPYNLFSAYQYRTQIRTCEVYTYVTTPVLSPRTMYYSNHTLYGNNGTGASGYMYCYAQNNYNLIGPGSSQYANENAQLYRKLTLDITAIGGRCGDTLFWQFDPDTGVLRIFGTGDMWNYNISSNLAPWRSYANDIIRVEVEEGAAGFNYNTLHNCYHLETISFPTTLIRLSGTLYYLPAFTAYEVAEGNPIICSVEGVLFDNTMTRILHYPANRPGDIYYIPDGVETIGGLAFYGVSNLDALVVPASVNRVEDQAFSGMYVTSFVLFLGAPPEYFGSQDMSGRYMDLFVYNTMDHLSEWGPYINTTYYDIHMAGPFNKDAWYGDFTIEKNEDYLIGISNGEQLYLMVNYNVNASNHYYLSINANYYGYTAKALTMNNSVGGVSGNADDLQYCTWKFVSGNGGPIQSGYEPNRYLFIYGTTGYADLYPATNNSYHWTYDPADLVLFTTNTEDRYVGYYSDGTNDLMEVNSGNSDGVYLFRQFDIDIPEPEILYGDIDGNGVVDMSDVSMLFSYLNGGTELSPEALAAADVNGDGFVNVMDISAIYSIIANS